MPIGLRLRVTEHVLCHGAEGIDHRWVEVGAAPLAGDLDGGLRAAGAVKHLNDVGEVEQPG